MVADGVSAVSSRLIGCRRTPPCRHLDRRRCGPDTGRRHPDRAPPTVATWHRQIGVGRSCSLASCYYAVTLFQVHDRPQRPGPPGRRDRRDGRGAVRRPPVAAAAGRLDHVVELWDEGLAPVVVVTGGNQPGDRFTEAEASAKYLSEHGVAAERSCRRTRATAARSRSTRSSDLLHERGLHRVLLVSDPYHSLRIRLMAAGARAHRLRVADPHQPRPRRTAFGKEIERGRRGRASAGSSASIGCCRSPAEKSGVVRSRSVVTLARSTGSP